LEPEQKWKQGFPLLLLIVFYALLAAGGFFTWAENRVYDTLVRLRGSETPSKEIVLITVDESSFRNLNRKWPWPRTLFAKAVEQIAKDGAKTVALDFLFTESGSREEDRIFENILNSVDIPVISGMSFYQEQEKYAPDNGIALVQQGVNLPVFPSLKYGFIHVFPDPDAVVRKAELARKFKNTLYPSFALAVHRAAGGSFHPQPGKQYLIHYRGGENTFSRVSFYQVVQGLLPQGFFHGKTVLIGPTFVAGKDHYPTPFPGLMPGVEIHANILSGLRNNDFYHKTPFWVDLFFLILFNTAIALLFILPLPALYRWAGFIASFPLYFLLTWLVFGAQWVPAVFLPALSFILTFALFAVLHHIRRTKKIQSELARLKNHDIIALEYLARKYDLTARERELVPLLTQKMSNPQICKKLFISINTLKTHIASIYKKTGAHSRKELKELLNKTTEE
jgi:adenylate cyclase